MRRLRLSRPSAPGGRTRRLRLSHRAFDWVLAGVFAVAPVVNVLTLDPIVGPRWLNALLVGLVAVGVLERRRRPLLGSSLFLGCCLILSFWLTSPSEIDTLFFGLLIFPWALGSHLDGRPAIAGLLMVYAVVVIVAVDSAEFIWGDIFFPGAFATLFWLGGRAARSRAKLTDELHEAAVRADEDREAEAALAVAEERRRIAREMHDVVAHSVSTMVIQAGGARRILALDPQRAIEAAELIERTGREAMSEMRHLLGVLHAGEEHAELAPQPTLHGLEALVDRSRAAGLPVDLRIEGERRELPAGVDLTAYRVVQEALTNALKHGGGAPAHVRLVYSDDDVHVIVIDEGSGNGAARLAGSGHGLVGMRERVRVCGGALHAGPRGGGGFEVHARLPLQDEEEAALAAAASA
jgi:signal transduction histidine kinase